MYQTFSGLKLELLKSIWTKYTTETAKELISYQNLNVLTKQMEDAAKD